MWWKNGEKNGEYDPKLGSISRSPMMGRATSVFLWLCNDAVISKLRVSMVGFFDLIN
jgi:hypothetical protein